MWRQDSRCRCQCKYRRGRASEAAGYGNAGWNVCICVQQRCLTQNLSCCAHLVPPPAAAVRCCSERKQYQVVGPVYSASPRSPGLNSPARSRSDVRLTNPAGRGIATGHQRLPPLCACAWLGCKCQAGLLEVEGAQAPATAASRSCLGASPLILSSRSDVLDAASSTKAAPASCDKQLHDETLCTTRAMFLLALSSAEPQCLTYRLHKPS